MRNLIIITFLLFSQICFSAVIYKPKVWIISDGTRECKKFNNDKGHVGDPDDLSAIAGYLLMSNLFETKGIVVGSTHHKELAKVPSEKDWCDSYFTKAYQHDLPNLNQNIGGYQSNIDFYESCIKKTAETYNPKKNYNSLKKYSTVKLLLDELAKSKDTLNVLCWGTLTEPAILVKNCISTKNTELLKRMRIIAHWTNSYYHVGTMQNPDSVHNAFGDAEACRYVKEMAKKGYFKYYECGAIGEYGIVRNGPKGKEYFDKFKTSELGRLFVTGKYVPHLQTVDDSDCAAYWALLGNWGVSLHDIASDGTNSPNVELRNENAFKTNSKSMRDELLRRSLAAASNKKTIVNIENVYPEKGLTDPHVLVDNGRVYMFCGHDQSWDTKDTWRMDHWEIHSSTDLIHWRKDGEILPTQTYIGNQPNCWAGYIVRKNDKYYWYFSDKYLSTGVMVADSPAGPWKDALGKPLLPTGIVGKIKPYDPTVFEENGVYTIIFGAGYYQAATLGEDMISLASEPKEIKVYGKDGKIRWTADKSTLFKRNNIYYLVWGSDYATSDKLYGPYQYKGAFLAGGHNDVFEWNNQMYIVTENKDLGLFYRGVSLKPLYFNEDGSVVVPKDDKGYPENGREWKFDISRMGWHAVEGTNLEWNKAGYIGGEINGNAIVENIMWGNTDVKDKSVITIRLRNNTSATNAKLVIATIAPGKSQFWEKTNIDWSKQYVVNLNIKPNCNDIQELNIKLSDYKDLVNKSIQQIRYLPAVGAVKGDWELHYLKVTKY